MREKIRWGVIGSTGIAKRRTIPEGIVPAKNATLVSVFSRNETANDEVAREFGARPARSVQELLSSDIDAVYIASPPAAHLGQTLACAAAGKHVLCEKPLGLSAQQAEQMVEGCAKAGVKLGTALMMRFHAQHQAALKVIHDGRIGKPVFARAQLSCWYPPIEGAWRQNPETGGGGSLMDLGGHCLDLLEMFFGPIESLSCMVNRTVHSYPSEDSAVVTCRFANGALGVVDALFCIPDASSKNVLELYGSKGSILARETIGQGDRGEMLAYIEPETSYEAQQSRASGTARVIEPRPVNTYQAEIEEFSQALLEGREPSNNGDLGLRSQRLLAACYDAAQQCVTVRV